MPPALNGHGKHAAMTPSAADYRQPTVAEAAWFINRSLDSWYRARCLDYWRDRYGAAFVAQIARKVKPTQEELLP